MGALVACTSTNMPYSAPASNEVMRWLCVCVRACVVVLEYQCLNVERESKGERVCVCAPD
jgi:hypothetical protein